MASNIDPSVPIFGSPTTASVRHNFLIAKQEIEALQTAVGLTTPVTVADGGTGANNAEDARENLGVIGLEGGSMTGPLRLSGDPTDLLGAVTKQYVDAYFPVSIARGGTGANNATGARQNLGAAPIASPAFTGLPTAPTPPNGDSSTIIATTAFVHSVVTGVTAGVSSVTAGSGLSGGGTGAVTIALNAPVSVANGGTGATTAPQALTNLGAIGAVSPAFTGIPTAPTATGGNNSTQLATTAFVQNAVSGSISLNSPAFTGNPTAPTAAPGDNDTTLATTAFVTTALAGYLPLVGGTLTGALTLNGNPVNTLHSATKQYVDQNIAGQALWQGVYHVASNTPTLPATPGNGYSWTAVTANPAVSEALTVALPPLTVGTIVTNGDILEYSTGQGWVQIKGGNLVSISQTDQLYVRLGGSTMTGALNLFANPTTPLMAATKQYVDNLVGAAGGGTITGVSPGTGLTGGGSVGTVTIGLVVPVSVANGGTGATTTAGALSSMGGAPIASPTFTGTPTAPNPATGDSSQALATTFWVRSQNYITGNQTIALSGDVSGSGTTAITASVIRIRGIAVSPTAPTSGQVLGYDGSGWVPVSPVVGAPTNSPAFTGNPTGPTPSAGDNSSSLATTAYVRGALVSYLPLVGGTLSGRLYLPADPISSNEASTKQYVDNRTSTAYLPLTGGTLTGGLNGVNLYTSGVIQSGFDGANFSQLSGGTAMFTSASATDQLTLYSTSGYARVRFNTATVPRQWTAGGWNNGWFEVTDETAGSPRFAIDTSGVTYNGNGVWTILSDESLKRDIVDYPYGMSEIRKLRARSYRLKEGDGSLQHGLVAQEVKDVLPHLVGEVFWSKPPKEADGGFTEGSKEKLMTVAPTGTIYCVLNALKELDARLERLEKATSASPPKEAPKEAAPKEREKAKK